MSRAACVLACTPILKVGEGSCAHGSGTGRRRGSGDVNLEVVVGKAGVVENAIALEGQKLSHHRVFAIGLNGQS